MFKLYVFRRDNTVLVHNFDYNLENVIVAVFGYMADENVVTIRIDDVLTGKTVKTYKKRIDGR